MNFYLVELVGKWVSLAFITLCPIKNDKEIVNIQNQNNNLKKDSSITAKEVKYTTITKDDPTLEVGKTKVEKAGVNGLVYTTDSMDIVIDEMVPQVVLKGTKKLKKPIVDTKIVYDGLTMEQLVAKLNKNLKSNLSGKGDLYAKYSLEYGVDPYLAVSISLLETGCNAGCSNLVKNKNNVGGMMGPSGALSFDTLEEGIKKFIKNIKVNYYDYGLKTPEQMNPKYAASKTWAQKVNKYMETIKAS